MYLASSHLFDAFDDDIAYHQGNQQLRRRQGRSPAHASFEPELTFLVDCNWKTYVDNYQEGCHIPPLHPGLNRDLDWKRYRVVNFAGDSLHEAPPKGRSVHPGTFGWRFPNFTFNSYPDGLSFMRMEPAGHTQTRLVYHYYRPDSVSVEDFEATVTYGTLVSEEDQRIVPLIQQNLDAGVYNRGPLSPRHAIGKDGRANDAYSEENQFIANQMGEAESVSARKATLLNPTEDDETIQVLRRRLFEHIDEGHLLHPPCTTERQSPCRSHRHRRADPREAPRNDHEHGAGGAGSRWVRGGGRRTPGA